MDEIDTEAGKPFRYRHDGWTPERQTLFLARLAETGCVKDACRAVGLSGTNAYRARKRMPDFAARWDTALSAKRPVLEQAAFDRAVHGVEVAYRQGRQVVRYRRYSDGLLKYLLERDERRREQNRAAWRPATPEETRESILTKVAAVRERRKAEEREEALVYEERMRAEGWAP